MQGDEFFGPGNDIKPARLHPEHETSIENWRAAIRRGQIAFLPRATSGNLYWYGFAPTQREQKELLTLLDAWVGPTFSDLPRSRGRLYPKDPFDTALATNDVPPLRFEVLPRGSGAARDEVRQALLVLSKLVWKRPRSEFDAPRTTVEVLDDLGHAIGAQDRRIALACLRELEAFADLDHSNLAFLRLRVHAGLRDVAAIFADQDLEHVLQLRRPLGITRLLQHAVYERYLEAADASGEGASLLEAADRIPTGLRTLTTGGTAGSRPALVVEFVLARLGGAATATLERWAEEAQSISPALTDTLRLLIAPNAEPTQTLPADPSAKPDVTPTDELHRLIEEGEFAAAIIAGLAEPPSTTTAALLLGCIRELEDTRLAGEVAAFVEASGLEAESREDDVVVRADLEWLAHFLTPLRNHGWLGWFDALRSNDVAGMDVDFSVSADWSPLDHATVANCLASLDEESLARLGDHGGAFMAAHSSLFAGSDGAELCERVLAGFAVSEKNTVGIRIQTVALLEYLSASGPEPETLASSLLWTEDILRAGTSAVTASWTVDVLQAATASPQALSLDAKTRLFYSALEVLRPVRSSLSLAEIEGLRLVADELTTALPEDFEIKTLGEDPAAPYRHLEDSVVVLYSLTESAITRAAQVLRRLIPGIDVRTASDHDGSQQLAALSSNADVFVMVAASAKHAATNFIKDHRGGRPVIQVNSRGSSAILRELAEG
ncbi:protein DpdD [Terrabacter sp. Ter38]|uniref:protein DpdD n=1 Tax=Terrabacter sp. Ter38 TaxID=2926030 RepID=UPI002118EB99|nr:protein DpdD [Terrabacter sp. Ter38]